MAGPLEGLRVLELATGIAGPYAGRLLAMLGATVVKREASGPDPIARQPLDSRPVDEPGALEVHLNAGKRRITGRVRLERAVDWADVVLEGRVALLTGGAACIELRL